MTPRAGILGVLALSFLASCSGCPGPKWEGADALVAELRCGLGLLETKEFTDRFAGLIWIETGVEPWDRAFRRGNTSVALDFEDSGLVAYEISWESRFMFSEAMAPVRLCPEVE